MNARPNSPAPKRRRAHQRRGSAYVLVLSIALVVLTVGLSVLALARVETRMVRETNEWTEAALLASAAVEHAVNTLDQTPSWRTTFTHDTQAYSHALGSGTMSWKLIDPTDTSLSNDQHDPVVIRGRGQVGGAIRIYSLRMHPAGDTIGPLSSSIHAGMNITVGSGKVVTVTGGPVTCNGTLDNDGTIDGDVEAGSVVNTGTITGSITTPIPAKRMPIDGTFKLYQSMATPIAPGAIDKQVLTAGYNPWGALNPDGVYYIEADVGDLVIKDARIHGTLVIRCTGGSKVIVDGSVSLQPHRTDFPVLVVLGDVDFRFQGAADDTLDEAALSTNFNPAGAPDATDATDGDTSDVYPSEVRGLVYAIGSVDLDQASAIDGVLIAEQNITFSSDIDAEFIDLTAAPPIGFTAGASVAATPMGWGWETDG